MVRIVPKAVKKTKAYRKCREVFLYFTRQVWCTAYLYNFFFCVFHKGYSAKRVSMCAVDEYIKAKNKVNIVFSHNETGYAYNRIFFNEVTTTNISEYAMPDVFAGIIENAKVYGGAAFVRVDKLLLQPNYDAETSMIFRWTNEVLRVQSGNNALIRYKNTHTSTIDKAIFVCGNACNNYYHAIVETFPRIVLADKDPQLQDWPLLIDSSMKEIPNLISALNLVNSSNREIIWLEKNIEYNVRNLAYISSCSWLPVNTKSKTSISDKYLVVCKSALSLARERIIKSLKNTAEKHDKIYIARYLCERARLINDKEVAKFFEEHGYTVIHPQTMTFEEQVRTFLNAKVVVGCAGAALTNLLFCNSGVKTYIFAPKSHDSNFWSSYAVNTGAICKFVDCTVTKSSEFFAGDEFRVDMNLLPEIIKDADIASISSNALSSCK